MEDGVIKSICNSCYVHGDVNNAPLIDMEAG